MNDNTERTSKKVLGESGGVDHEETTHEGHGLSGAVAAAEVSMDNRNCIVGEARYHPDKVGGNTGISGSAIPTPSCEGATSTEKEDADEDVSTTDVSDVGVIDPTMDDEDAPETCIEVNDAGVTCDDSEVKGHKATLSEFVHTFVIHICSEN